MKITQLAFALAAALLLGSCRTTKTENERTFASGKSSNDVLAGVHAQPSRPRPTPSFPPDPFEPKDPVEQGAFHQVCQARDQLPSPQAFTVKALLLAVHQNDDCAAGETWLRNKANRALRIESAPLVELLTLELLQNYPHIADIYIKIADGVERRCPLPAVQTCHWVEPIP